MVLPSDLVNEFDDENTTDDATDDTKVVVDDTTADDNADDNKTDDSTDDKTVDDATDDKGDDKTADDKTAGKVDDDEGYYADEEGAEDATVTTTPEVPPAPANFTPEEKYIVDNLPQVSVRIVQADDSIKTVQVRSATELPQSMKGIASAYEAEIFHAAMAAQEGAARQLQTYYRQHQSQLQAEDFEKKENASIRDDIAELQRDGEIPKFKAQPGTRAFDADPAAKVVQETIEFMNERNAKYLERSNSGGVYRHIGFAEAYELMNGNGRAKTQNSAARREAAKKLVSGQGGSTKTAPKAAVSGKTLQEVAAEFDNFEA